MSVKAVMKVLHNVEVDYPDRLKQEIFDTIGKIDHINIYGQEVLVAPFVSSPFIGNTSLVKGEKEQLEDKWQSKCFMILKVGDGVVTACQKINRAVPKVGAWYFGDVQEHKHVNIRGVDFKGWTDPKDPNQSLRPWGKGGGWPCRFVLVGDIKGDTTRPQDIV